MLRISRTTRALVLAALVGQTASAGLLPQRGEPESARALPATATIEGTFFLPSGEPAPGVTLRLQVVPNSTLSGSGGGSSVELEETSLADGSVLLHFEPRSAHRYEVEAQLEGHAPVSWRWATARAGASFLLGEVVFERAGVLAGRLLDRRGRPIADRWQVLALPQTGTLQRPRGIMAPVVPQARFESEGTDGSFRFEGLPEGPCRLRFYLEAAGWFDGPETLLRGGDETRVDLCYEGPDLDRRIHVHLISRPLTAAWPDLRRVVLRDEAGGWWRPYVSEKIHRGLDFEGLEPGYYRLEINDPRFEPVVVENLSPGEGSTSVYLTGSSALRLVLHEPEGADPIERYEVRLRLGRSLFPPLDDPWRDIFGSGNVSRPANVRLHGSSEEPLPRGFLAGLVPGESTLLVSAPGYATSYVPLDLKSGEFRVLEVPLHRGGELAGVVVDIEGRPALRGTTVSLFVPGEEELRPLDRYFGDDLPPPGMLGRGYERAQTRTDDRGSFLLMSVTPGTYLLRAQSPDQRSGVLQEVEIEDGRTTRVRCILEDR